MTFRDRLPVPAGAGSHVYSTYTMLPSPLTSPYNFKVLAVDPLGYGAGGTMPVPKPPSTWIGAPTRCGYTNVAEICFAAVFTPVTVTVSWHGETGTQGAGPPTSTINFSPTKNPVIVAGAAPLIRTPTFCAPTAVAAAKLPLPGSAIRPACPTSCCSNSVALRTPAWSCVRFQIVRWELVICRRVEVTALEMIR